MYSPSWWNWLPHLQTHKFWEIDFKDLRCYCPKVRKNLFDFPDVVMVVKHVAYFRNFTYLCFKDCSTRFSRQNYCLFIRKLRFYLNWRKCGRMQRSHKLSAHGCISRPVALKLWRIWLNQFNSVFIISFR